MSLSHQLLGEFVSVISRPRIDSGFSYIGIITAITLFSLFSLVAYQGLHIAHRFQRNSSILRLAIVEAVNSIESLKINQNYSEVNGLTLRKENFEIIHKVTEFNDQLYKILIEIRDLEQNEIFILETLAE
jgi:hypothetical protein